MKEQTYPIQKIDIARSRAAVRPFVDGGRFVVGVDPGLRACGVAVLLDGELLSCAVVRNPERAARGGAAWSPLAVAVHDYIGDVIGGALYVADAVFGTPYHVALAAERMVVRATRRDVDSDDLLELAGIVGCIAGRVRLPAMLFAPEVWKGQLEKRIHHQRLLRDLTPAEQQVVSADLFADSQGVADYIDACKRCGKGDVPGGSAHNAIDAIGIARYGARVVEHDKPLDGADLSAYVSFRPSHLGASVYRARHIFGASVGDDDHNQ